MKMAKDDLPWQATIAIPTLAVGLLLSLGVNIIPVFRLLAIGALIVGGGLEFWLAIELWIKSRQRNRG